ASECGRRPGCPTWKQRDKAWVSTAGLLEIQSDEFIAGEVFVQNLIGRRGEFSDDYNAGDQGCNGSDIGQPFCCCTLLQLNDPDQGQREDLYGARECKVEFRFSRKIRTGERNFAECDQPGFDLEEAEEDQEQQ